MSTPLSIGSSTFSNRSNATLYVPKGAKSAYSSANYWKDFASIKEFPDSDVNQDGEVDVADVVDIARFVIDNPSDSFDEFLADINIDNDVDISDAVTLVNEILGDTEFTKSRDALATGSANDVLSLVDNGDGTLSLCMNNETDFTAFQFELNLPDGMDVASIVLNKARKNGHQILFNKVKNGCYKVTALSVSNNTFQGGIGELLRFSLDGLVCDDVVVDDIRFITPQGMSCRFDDLLVSGAATDIDGILSGAGQQTNDGFWYSISGAKMGERPTAPGIYIHNGKKIRVK
jgi:hypothetical protein